MVIHKEHHERLIKKLRERFAALLKATKGRPLKTGCEGLKRGSWIHPEKMLIIPSKLDKDLAVEDFKNILAEFKKLK